MPIYNNNYVAPVWVNDQPPAIDETEMLAISRTIQASQILKGAGAPTQYTAGTVGQRYADTSTTPYSIYRLVTAAQDANVWKRDDSDGNLALDYNSTSTYSKGNYCIYAGNLYKATTNIQTPEGWTPGHWQQVYLADEVESTANSLAAHVANTSNPHSVTKAQVGLGNVDNTSDANKPVSTPQQAAILNAVGRAPRISSAGEWEVWDVATGAYVSTGYSVIVNPPTVANTAAQMTNHDQVYIYNGSETGYQHGYWYYWNGSAWAPGGAYQVAATDKTLTVADAAADAKATGDKLGELKSIIHERIADTVGFVRTNLFISELQYNGHNVYTSDCTVTLTDGVFTMTPTGASPKFGNTLPAGDALNPNLPYGFPFPIDGVSSLWVEISNDIFNRNYVTFFDENLVSLGFTDYISTSKFEVSVPSGAVYASLRIGSNRTTVGTPYGFTVRCYNLSDGKKTALQIIGENTDAIRSNTELGFETYPGYWSNTGAILAPGAETQEVYTNYIPVSNGDKFDLEISLPTAKSMWAVCTLFDATMTFLSRTALISIVTGDSFERSITISNASAAYMSLSYRTYGIADVTLIGHTVAKTLYKMMPGANLVHYTNPIVKGVNHRGYVSAPENTLPAFRLSRKMGFEYVETDVEFTSDGVPVLLHDATINRTARNADGTALSETVNIHDITYEQALTYDFGIYKGAEYAGTKIPTVEQFFALCRNLGLRPYVEFKNGSTYTQAQVEAVIDIAKKYGMRDSVSWISFNGDYLTYVKNYDSKARIGYVCESPGDDQIAVILSLRTDENEVFADCHYSSINSTGAGKCIRNGIPLEAWTLNAKTDLAALNPYVTGVTTDSLDIAQTLYWQGMA